MIRRLAPWLGRLARDERGVAAIEASLVGSLLILTLLNGVEIGRYAYSVTQVNAASQAGAQAAIIACDTTKMPATLSCPELESAVTAAIGGGSLGDRVVQHGDLEESWQCLTDRNELQKIADADDPRPINCEAAGDANQRPGLYIRVQTELEYDPLFPDLTLVRSFDSMIVRTAWMRLL